MHGIPLDKAVQFVEMPKGSPGPTLPCPAGAQPNAAQSPWSPDGSVGASSPESCAPFEPLKSVARSGTDVQRGPTRLELDDDENISPSLEGTAKADFKGPPRRRRGFGERPASIDSTRYKTQMCRNWQLHEKCPYGPRCQFAHGLKELQHKTVPEVPGILGTPVPEGPALFPQPFGLGLPPLGAAQFLSTMACFPTVFPMQRVQLVPQMPLYGLTPMMLSGMQTPMVFFGV